jgi:hypothetical protein
MAKNRRTSKIKQWAAVLHFYTIRLPGVFVLAPLGFVFEFVVTSPWRLAVALESCRRKKGKKI